MELRTTATENSGSGRDVLMEDVGTGPDPQCETNCRISEKEAEMWAEGCEHN